MHYPLTIFWAATLATLRLARACCDRSGGRGDNLSGVEARCRLKELLLIGAGEMPLLLPISVGNWLIWSYSWLMMLLYVASRRLKMNRLLLHERRRDSDELVRELPLVRLHLQLLYRRLLHRRERGRRRAGGRRLDRLVDPGSEARCTSRWRSHGTIRRLGGAQRRLSLIAGGATRRNRGISSRHHRRPDDGRERSSEIRVPSRPPPIPQVAKPTPEIGHPKWTFRMHRIASQAWSCRRNRIEDLNDGCRSGLHGQARRQRRSDGLGRGRPDTETPWRKKITECPRR